MITQLTVIEDAQMQARFVQGQWLVEITANGHEHTAVWSTVQYAAVCALAIGYGEEGGDTQATAALYEVAEPLFADLTADLRIIP